MLLSSELIGYPAGARVLIVNCDDFGMSATVNAAVIRAVEEGIATSCSLMVPCPAAPQAMALLKDRPHVPFGIHLTLVCDTGDRSWGPLTAHERVPSLLDDDGALVTPGRTAELLARARIDEVELEFRAQIDAVLAAGLAPTHVDWHCLADGGRDDIFDLTLALADEYGVALRVWRETNYRKARRVGRPAVDHPFLDSFNTDQTRYAELLRAVPPGLSEWAVHPGAATDPGGEIRRTDLDFLVSPAAREIVRREGIILIDYRFAPPA
ncbi:MAG: polysaccharide deacetylase family protein [Actinoplanes sp.]